MRCLLIEVDCGERYCGECRYLLFIWSDAPACRVFDLELKRTGKKIRIPLVRDKENRVPKYINRCPECLAAEQKEQP